MLIYGNQVEKLDCGVSVIQTLYRYFYNEHLSFSNLKNRVIYSNKGISIASFCKLANEFNILTTVLKGDFQSFKEIKINQPIVSIIRNDNFYHYVIIEKITNKKNVILFDPSFGKRKIPLNDFEKMFTGIIIECLKIKNNLNKQKRKFLDEINIYSFEFKKENLCFIFSSLIICFLSFISTLYLKIVFDQFSFSSNRENFFIITFLFILVLILKLIISFVNEIVIHKIELKKQSEYVFLYLEKIKNIDLLKIKHMHESDHLKNWEIITKIASFKSNFLFSFFTNILTLIISSVFLFILNFKIFLISSMIVAVLISINWLFNPKFKNASISILNSTKKLNENYLDYIKGIEQIKLKKIENSIENNFNFSLEKVLLDQLSSMNFIKIFEFINSLIKNIAPFTIITISLIDFWNPNMTIGNIFVYISLSSYFVDSCSSISNVVFQIPILKNELDNLNSFFNYENEINQKDKILVNDIKSIKLEKLNFAYPGDNKQIKINNLLFKDKINLKGKNGSGKSTILKIISTIYYSEKILYNNIEINNLNLNSIRKQICYISHNQFLPSVSIYDYLVDKNDDNLKYLMLYYKKYKLHKLLEKSNLSLSHKIENNGINFSQGQKQLIAILKLFSSDFSVVIFDEAFDNIDLNLKKELFKILKNHLKEKLVIEVSHDQNYIFNGVEINIENIK